MLETLSHYYPLAVISVRGNRKTMSFLDYFGLSHYFKVIVTGQTCQRSKPHPEPLHWTAKQLGLLPESCLMVGDTTVDILAGKTAGMQTAGVLCGFGEKEELARAGADLILEKTPDLVECLGFTS